MRELMILLLFSAFCSSSGLSESEAKSSHHPPLIGPYTPAPYTPIPLPYSPTPVGYGYTPAPPAYTAVPLIAKPLGHGVAPYGPPHPHPPGGYGIPPTYGPPPPPLPAYGPPACSIGNPRPWCLEDKEYPVYDIQHALEYHYDAVQQMYKDVLANTDNSIDRLNEIVQETYICPTDSAYIQPVRGVNVNGEWKIIVNHVKAHYETLTQTARIEACLHPGAECPLVPECYESKCIQKSIYHRFLVYDPYDQYLPFALDSFKLPSACACLNGAYIEPPHKK